LLERAAKLSRQLGGGSLTALPIAATEEGNLAAYIPTNLVSITDGQIALDSRLFHEGQKPAVNVGKSVSRVGGKTQSPAMRKLSEKLRLEYAQFLELEIFTRFGGMLDERTRGIIDHGKRIRAILTQQQYEPLSLAHQVALLVAMDEKLIDRVPLDKVIELRSQIADWFKTDGAQLGVTINSGNDIDPDGHTQLRAMLAERIDRLVASAVRQ
jgi:F0F1-type ATP synthase alpha subunit